MSEVIELTRPLPRIGTAALALPRPAQRHPASRGQVGGNSLECNEQPPAEEDMTFSLTAPFILLFGGISWESLL
jgi:hypothetical protein